MRKETKKAPTIRFRGFTDDWEQRKLGDISSLITKGTTPKDKSGTGDVNFIKVENINDFSGNITGMSKISLEEHQGYLKRSQLQEGDILFSIAGTLGRVTSVNKAILPANTNQALSIIRLKEGNLEYVKTCLKGNVVADFIRKNPTIGAQPNLSLEQVSNLKIEIPSETEQKIIGEYFSNLDNLITLHQRKLDQLKKLKKYFLQNMFPAKGEKVPRIRFKGFTGDWEQRKFKNEVKISNEMVDPKTGLFDELIHIGPGDIEPYTGQLVSEIKTVKESDLISGKFHFYKGDIIYSKIRPELSKCIIAPEDGLASADAYVLHGNENICQEFLYCILQTRSFYSYSTSVSMRTGMPKINREELGSYDFYAPSIKEQRTIGNFLIGLDKLITLHQRKLNQLLTMKKFMLQNLFI